MNGDNIDHIFLICSKVTTVHLYEIDDKTEMFFLHIVQLFISRLKNIHFYNIFFVFSPLTIPDILVQKLAK